jgi:hypothetical protein
MQSITRFVLEKCGRIRVAIAEVGLSRLDFLNGQIKFVIGDRDFDIENNKSETRIDVQHGRNALGSRRWGKMIDDSELRKGVMDIPRNFTGFGLETS